MFQWDCGSNSLYKITHLNPYNLINTDDRAQRIKLEGVETMIFPKEILSQNVSKTYIPVLNSTLQVTIQGQSVTRKQAKAQLINASSKMFAVVIHDNNFHCNPEVGTCSK